MNSIREPAVAGQFYPGAAGELTAAVATLLGEVRGRDGPAPKALIVPHAGYIYSGPTAAAAYARLERWRDRFARVVLLGPCHRVPVHGIATSGADAFRTPLGDVPLATGAITAQGLPVAEAAHRFEHSIEVHLPFLQSVLGAFELLPIVVGKVTPSVVADVLERLWGGPETLIVVSSDLSHYLDYETAHARDHATCERIERFDPQHIDFDDACGATAVGGLLIAAKRHGLRVETIDLRNSGDTAGDREQVVGYGAWMFTEPQ